MKKIVSVFLAIFVAAGAWYWSRHYRTPVVEAAETKPAARVEVAPLQQQSIARSLDAFGVVGSAPSSEIAISAKFDCVVRAVHVSVGSRVAAGDVLLEIDPSPDTQLMIAAARTALTVAEKTLTATQERIDFKLATNQDLLVAKQAAEDARSKIANFEARGFGGNGEITASSVGVVSKCEISRGSLVTAGTALVTVASADRFEARLGVEIAQLAQVKPGQPVTLSSANRPDLPPTSSTVRALGGTIDATAGTAEIRVTLPSTSPLYLGEHVKGSIIIEQAEGLVAPRSAVLPDDEKQVLFTVKDGKAVKHEVKLGIVAEDRIQVISDDLHPGDAVVTLGNYELADGTAVQGDEKAGGSEEHAHAAQEAKP